MLSKVSSSLLCQRLMIMRVRSGEIPKPDNANNRGSRDHNDGTLASATIKIIRDDRSTDAHSDENCGPISTNTTSKAFCATFTMRSSGGMGIVCHSSGWEVPHKTSKPDLW